MKVDLEKHKNTKSCSGNQSLSINFDEEFWYKWVFLLGSRIQIGLYHTIASLAKLSRSSSRRHQSTFPVDAVMLIF